MNFIILLAKINNAPKDLFVEEDPELRMLSFLLAFVECSYFATNATKPLFLTLEDFY